MDAGVASERRPDLAPVVETTQRSDPSARIALWLFVVFLVVSFFLLMFAIGDYYWFFADDWFFLAGREARSLHDVFAPYNSHWSTVPILAYRALYAMFGTRTYVPYQAGIVALHLTACALLRVVMRRAGVGPWIATAAAAAFVLFGPGQQNIIWAFQIGFTGSLVFGLTHMVLADHDGSFDRRDGLGVVAGVLALMSSGVGITMALVVALSVLLRRGWKLAALHTAPLAAVYGVWWLVERPELATRAGRPPARVVYEWVRSGEIGTFLALGKFQLVAALLAVVLVAGLALAWTRLPWAELRRRASMPAALLLGGLAFSAMTALGRFYFGTDFARSSRYLHIGAAMLLPALAVGADALARQWRFLVVPMVAIFLVAVPWNANNFEDPILGPAFMDNQKVLITNVVRLPEAKEVPGTVRPIPTPFANLTIGYLLRAEATHKLTAATGALTPQLRNELLVRLGVSQTAGASAKPCRRFVAPVDVRVAKGTVLGMKTPLRIANADERRLLAPPVLFDPAFGGRLTIELDGLAMRITPAPPQKSFVLCGAAAAP